MRKTDKDKVLNVVAGAGASQGWCVVWSSVTVEGSRNLWGEMRFKFRKKCSISYLNFVGIGFFICRTRSLGYIVFFGIFHY